MTATFGEFLTLAGDHIAGAVAFRGELPDSMRSESVGELGRPVGEGGPGSRRFAVQGALRGVVNPRPARGPAPATPPPSPWAPRAPPRHPGQHAPPSMPPP